MDITTRNPERKDTSQDNTKNKNKKTSNTDPTINPGVTASYKTPANCSYIQSSPVKSLGSDRGKKTST